MTSSHMPAERTVDSAVDGHTTLHGPWLLAARAAWVVLVVSVLVLWSLGTAAHIREPLPDCTVVACDPVDFNAGDLELAEKLGLPTGLIIGPLGRILGTFPNVLFFLVAGVIFWRRSYDWMGLLVSFALVFIGGLLFTSANDVVTRTYPQLESAIGIAFEAGFVCIIALLLLFPDGRFVPRWTRRAAPLLLAALILSELLQGRSDAADAIGLTVVLMAVATGLYSQVYRYLRVSGPTERQQTKWVVIGIMGAVALGVVWGVVAAAFPPDEPSESRIYALLVAQPVLILLLFCVPLSFAISILRYRLWDIDVVINRTLVYAVLTATLVGTYFGIVVGLQAAFGAVTDQGSAVAVVMSTLAIAALFQPLRRRIQDFIDRRFYRRKYDAALTLAGFGDRIRDEVDLEKLREELVGLVHETMQPAHASLWLRQAGTRRRAE